MGKGFNLLNLASRIGYINNDDYVAYYNFDFEDGPDSIIIKASCGNSSSGSIKLFLDSLNGQLIGTFPISYTGGWENYELFRFPVNTAFEGVHKFYFLFYGNHEYDLMNLESIQFKIAGVSDYEQRISSALKKIYIYPNPAKDYIKLKINENAVAEEYGPAL